jgi:SAM-dependent methyltransferase
MSTDEMTLAETLPQADASSLVDRDALETQVKDMYRQVAREEDAQLHFEVGRDGFAQVEFVEGSIEALPFEDAAFDVVVSNGVINLSPVKHLVFAEAARVLRPGGRLALADIVSGRALKERTRRNVELWAACIRRSRALDACSTYGVESISLFAVR